MNNLEINNFLEEHGDSTLFTIKVYTEPSNEELMTITVGLQMQLSMMYESLCQLMCIIEEVSEQMANDMHEYRGFMVNFIINKNCSSDAEEIFKHITYGFDHLRIRNSPRGFKELESNV